MTWGADGEVCRVPPPLTAHNRTPQRSPGPRTHPTGMPCHPSAAAQGKKMMKNMRSEEARRVHAGAALFMGPLQLGDDAPLDANSKPTEKAAEWAKGEC